jgi:hypothetical protein
MDTISDSSRSYRTPKADRVPRLTPLAGGEDPGRGAGKNRGRRRWSRSQQWSLLPNCSLPRLQVRTSLEAPTGQLSRNGLGAGTQAGARNRSRPAHGSFPPRIHVLCEFMSPANSRQVVRQKPAAEALASAGEPSDLPFLRTLELEVASQFDYPCAAVRTQIRVESSTSDSERSTLHERAEAV